MRRLLACALALVLSSCGRTEVDLQGGEAGTTVPKCDADPKLSFGLHSPSGAILPITQTLAISSAVLNTGPLDQYENCRQPPHVAEAFWFDIADPQGVVWTVMMSVSGAPNPVVVDQVVAVHYLQRANYVAELIVRTEEGQLLAYLTYGVDFASLTLPDGITGKRLNEPSCAVDGDGIAPLELAGC